MIVLVKCVSLKYRSLSLITLIVATYKHTEIIRSIPSCPFSIRKISITAHNYFENNSCSRSIRSGVILGCFEYSSVSAQAREADCGTWSGVVGTRPDTKPVVWLFVVNVSAALGTARFQPPPRYTSDLIGRNLHGRLEGVTSDGSVLFLNFLFLFLGVRWCASVALAARVMDYVL